MGIRARYLHLSEIKLTWIDKVPDVMTGISLRDKKFLNIDMAWHGIHYLLTGKLEKDGSPLSRAVLGLEETEIETVFGNASHLTPAQVEESARALSLITMEELGSRYKSGIMKGVDIYLPVYIDEDADNEKYFTENYENLRKHYIDAAEKGLGMMIDMG